MRAQDNFHRASFLLSSDAIEHDHCYVHFPECTLRDALHNQHREGPGTQFQDA